MTVLFVPSPDTNPYIAVYSNQDILLPELEEEKECQWSRHSIIFSSISVDNILFHIFLWLPPPMQYTQKLSTDV